MTDSRPPRRRNAPERVLKRRAQTIGTDRAPPLATPAPGSTKDDRADLLPARRDETPGSPAGTQPGSRLAPESEESRPGAADARRGRRSRRTGTREQQATGLTDRRARHLRSETSTIEVTND